MALTENLDAFTADFGVTVTDGTTVTTGILDAPGEVLAGGQIISTDYQLTIKAGVYPALKYDDPLTIGGVPYTVRSVTPLDDGAMVTVSLAKN